MCGLFHYPDYLCGLISANCNVGDVLAPGSLAEVGCSLSNGETVEGCEGIIMRVLGDGHTYSFVLTSSEFHAGHICWLIWSFPFFQCQSWSATSNLICNT